jgi:hypothetical protein
MFNVSPSKFTHFPTDTVARSVPNLRSVRNEFDFLTIAPAGYHVAVRMSFSHPLEARTELPTAWLTEYTNEGLVLRDPAMKWIYDNRGSVRVSEMGVEDPAGVIGKAAKHGLRFGAVISYSDPVEKTFVSCGQFYRADREYTNLELGHLLSRVKRLHRLTGPAPSRPSPDFRRMEPNGTSRANVRGAGSETDFIVWSGSQCRGAGARI